VTEVIFDKAFFSPETLKKAGYRFIDQFSVDFSSTEHSYVCRLAFKTNKTTEAIAALIKDFRNEVLDQDLRERIKQETEPVRNLILAHAFSKTSLVQHE